MEESKYNYKLIIAYDGTYYSGWQIQPNGPSIQEQIQTAIKIILRQEVLVIGSGRTDAGVHALGQIAHFKTDHVLDLHRFLGSLNGLLPRDIRIKGVEPAPLHFHAQYSAISKTYHYHVTLERFQDPFIRLYSYHALEKIDVEKLASAARYFIGTHDFTSFANEAHTGTAAHDPIRTLKRLDIVLEKGGLRLEFEADGFLYKMVRNITGTLLEVASDKRSEEEIPLLLDLKDRKKAGRAVPAHGLFLVQVDYN